MAEGNIRQRASTSLLWGELQRRQVRIDIVALEYDIMLHSLNVFVSSVGKQLSIICLKFLGVLVYRTGFVVAVRLLVCICGRDNISRPMLLLVDGSSHSWAFDAFMFNGILVRCSHRVVGTFKC